MTFWENKNFFKGLLKQNANFFKGLFEKTETFRYLAAGLTAQASGRQLPGHRIPVGSEQVIRLLLGLFQRLGD